MADNPKVADGQAGTDSQNQQDEITELKKLADIGRAVYQPGYVETGEEAAKMLKNFRRALSQKRNDYFDEPVRKDDDNNEPSESPRWNKDMFKMAIATFRHDSEFRKYEDDIWDMLSTRRFKELARNEGPYTAIEEAFTKLKAERYDELSRKQRESEVLESRRREQERLNPGVGSTGKSQPSPDEWFSKAIAKVESEYNLKGRRQFMQDHDGKSYKEVVDNLNKERLAKLGQDIT